MITHVEAVHMPLLQMVEKHELSQDGPRNGHSPGPKQNIQYAKTPTLNLHKKVNGEFRMVEWGWKSKLVMQSPSASKYVQLYQYKLYLDDSVALTPWKKENGVSVLKAISDYLGALHDNVV
ncbi:hypothetical protein EDD21DRAFT_447297 [Dissophora ornata]|nr:hypothetical protein EDD21DRAFT_447297 [Dissophora ornata]